MFPVWLNINTATARYVFHFDGLYAASTNICFVNLNDSINWMPFKLKDINGLDILNFTH